MFQLSLKRNDKDTELAKSHLAGIRKGIFPGKVLFLLFSYSIRYTPPSFFTVLPVIFRKAHTTSSRDSSLPNSRLYTSTAISGATSISTPYHAARSKAIRSSRAPLYLNCLSATVCNRPHPPLPPATALHRNRNGFAG